MATDLLNQLKTLKGLAAHLDLPLGHKDQPVPPQAVAKMEFEKDTKVPLAGGASFPLKAKATGQIDLFQGGEKAPKDPDGILSAPPPKTEKKAPPPVVSNQDESKAWLKTSLQGDLTAGASLPLGGPADLTFKASQTLRFCDYRIHLKTETLRSAFEADFGPPRLALSLKDIQNLDAGEALSLNRKGTLAATVKLSWSDIFAGSPARLASILKQGWGVGVKVETGLTLTASVSVDDDFRITFAGADDGKLRIALSKAETTETATGFKVGVTAQVTLPDTDFKSLLSGLFGNGGASLTKKAKATLKDELETLAKNKIEAGFTYEYDRISTDKVLLQGTLAPTDLTPEIHDAATQGNVTALLRHTPEYATLHQIAAEPPLLKLEQYLQQETYKESRCWGFSLSIGTWKIFKSLDNVESEKEISRDIQGFEKVAYKGGWTYTDKARKWTTDFKADMPEFSKAKPPDGPVREEFQLGFHLSRTLQGELGEAVLGDWLDWARLWRVIELDQEKGLLENLQALRGEQATATLQVLLDDEAVKVILSHHGDYPPFTAALASALPWVKDIEERANAGSRRKRYSNVWEWYLAKEPAYRWSPDLGMTIGQWFEGAPRASDPCIALERYGTSRDQSAEPQVRFADITGAIDQGALVGASRTIRDRIAKFQSGLIQLRDNPEGRHDLVIPTAFEQMMGIGSQWFLQRALGIYLLDFVWESPAWPGVVRSLVVTPADSKKKTLVFGNGGKTAKGSEGRDRHGS